ncbi:hypothetical protein SLEP1_g25465 [Rubroshorea leprosula]|uniref:Pentatricopeptide repeat-containing protein n=1 Tax=Rubroshorea leprosula TaxID=152421 RepID=A0AAV5JM25_9ROSI|nr:hypothetical protein SLEP1_g25465 [Rubroshorea leprosula]
MYRALSAHRLVYRARISRLVKSGLIDQATQVFDEMSQSDCRVFSLDYNRFIGVLVKHSRFDLAEQYYFQMLPQGFSLNSFTYSRFISGLCTIKNFTLIDILLRDMDMFNYVPDIWAFNIYLTVLCRDNMVDSLYDTLST